MTVDIASLVSDSLDIWTTAIARKSGAGRGGGRRINLYGIDRLRALILDLAVRGKLVPQDAADEPASALLKKIGAERAKLTKAGLIGKQRASETNPDEAPYSIPEGWAWTKLADIGHDWGQKEPSGDFTYVDVSSIDQRAGIIRSPSVLTASEAPSRARKIVRVGTVIYSTVRPYLLNIAIVDQEFEPEPIASTAFAIVHPFDGVAAGFLYRYLRSATFISYVEDCQTGIAYPAINDKQFFSAWFPLPPLAEQQRIVVKVDELMALCDALEAESAAAMAAHQALVEALLATLTASTDAADLATNWSRLEAHFDTLFNTEASVESLKQAILDLAVRGKLVAQDAQDETAARLLSELSKQRFKMIKSGALAKHKPIEFSTDWKPEFEPPSGWSWECFGNYTAELATGPFGTMIHKSDYVQGGTPLINPSHMIDDRIVEDHLVSLPEGKASELSSYKLQAGDIVFARRGEVGRLAIVTDREAGWLCGTGSFRARFTAHGIQQYLALFFRSDFARDFLGGESVGATMSNLNHAILNRLPVPIPPLAEQHRIVAKVDELMALCDALKARITDAAATQKHLADAITERAAA